MISFKQLRYFDAVARASHFGKAAEHCAVTQPALSMQIQELEKFLGVQLVERSRSGAMLTEAGREVAEGARGLSRPRTASARDPDPASHERARRRRSRSLVAGAAGRASRSRDHEAVHRPLPAGDAE